MGWGEVEGYAVGGGGERGAGLVRGREAPGEGTARSLIAILSRRGQTRVNYMGIGSVEVRDRFERPLVGDWASGERMSCVQCDSERRVYALGATGAAQQCSLSEGGVGGPSGNLHVCVHVSPYPVSGASFECTRFRQGTVL